MNRFIKIFPWLVTVLALAAAYFLCSTNKDNDDELARLRPQAEEISQLKTENAELKKLESQSGELAQLKKENVDLLKLRNEVRKLRDEKKQMTSQLQAAQARERSVQGEIQAQALRVAQQQAQLQASAQGQQISGFQVTQPTQADQLNACINNLRQIDGAKQSWAAENKKDVLAVPSVEDVAAYIKNGFPKCPAGGTYSIKPVNTDPTCSIPGHKLPPPQ